MKNNEKIELDAKTRANIEILFDKNKIVDIRKYNDGYLMYAWDNLGRSAAYLDTNLFVKKANYPNVVDFHIQAGNDVIYDPVFFANIKFAGKEISKKEAWVEIYFGHNYRREELSLNGPFKEELRLFFMEEFSKHKDWFKIDITSLYKKLFEILDPSLDVIKESNEFKRIR